MRKHVLLDVLSKYVVAQVEKGTQCTGGHNSLGSGLKTVALCGDACEAAIGCEHFTVGAVGSDYEGECRMEASMCSETTPAEYNLYTLPVCPHCLFVCIKLLFTRVVSSCLVTIHRNPFCNSSLTLSSSHSDCLYCSPNRLPQLKLSHFCEWDKNALEKIVCLGKARQQLNVLRSARLPQAANTSSLALAPKREIAIGKRVNVKALSITSTTYFDSHKCS